MSSAPRRGASGLLLGGGWSVGSWRGLPLGGAVSAENTKKELKDFLHKDPIKVRVGNSNQTYERQRLKLAAHLGVGGGVYVLDEPTTGLHLADLQQLLGLLDRLVDSGREAVDLPGARNGGARTLAFQLTSLFPRAAFASRPPPLRSCLIPRVPPEAADVAGPGRVPAGRAVS